MNVDRCGCIDLRYHSSIRRRAAAKINNEKRANEGILKGIDISKPHHPQSSLHSCYTHLKCNILYVPTFETDVNNSTKLFQRVLFHDIVYVYELIKNNQSNTEKERIQFVVI